LASFAVTLPSTAFAHAHVNACNHALHSMSLGYLIDEIWIRVCSGVDAYLIGTDTKQMLHLIDIRNSAADSERDKTILAKLFNRLEVGVFVQLVRHDVNQHQLINLTLIVNLNRG
jgi:hypothetical protein